MQTKPKITANPMARSIETGPTYGIINVLIHSWSLLIQS